MLNMKSDVSEIRHFLCALLDLSFLSRKLWCRLASLLHPSICNTRMIYSPIMSSPSAHYETVSEVTLVRVRASVVRIISIPIYCGTKAPTHPTTSFERPMGYKKQPSEVCAPWCTISRYGYPSCLDGGNEVEWPGPIRIINEAVYRDPSPIHEYPATSWSWYATHIDRSLIKAQCTRLPFCRRRRGFLRYWD